MLLAAVPAQGAPSPVTIIESLVVLAVIFGAMSIVPIRQRRWRPRTPASAPRKGGRSNHLPAATPAGASRPKPQLASSAGTPTRPEPQPASTPDIPTRPEPPSTANLPRQKGRDRTVRTAAGSTGRGNSQVVLTHKERVGRGLDFLADGLNQFTSAHLPTSSGAKDWADVLAARDRARGVRGREYSLSDPQFQLRVMTEEWRVFKDELPQVARGWASELRATRDAWAHRRSAFSDADADRALDTMERFLNELGAADLANHVHRIRALPPAASGDAD